MRRMMGTVIAALACLLAACDKGAATVGPVGDGSWSLEPGAFPDSVESSSESIEYVTYTDTLYFLGKYPDRSDSPRQAAFFKREPRTGAWIALPRPEFSYGIVHSRVIDSSIILFPAQQWNIPRNRYSPRYSIWESTNIEDGTDGKAVDNPIALDGKIIYLSNIKLDSEHRLFVCDTRTGRWDYRRSDLPVEMQGAYATAYRGMIYLVAKAMDRGGGQLRIGRMDPDSLQYKDLLRENVPDDYQFAATASGRTIYVAGRATSHPLSATRARALDLETLEFSDFGELPVRSPRYQIAVAGGKVLFMEVPSKTDSAGAAGAIYSRPVE